MKIYSSEITPEQTYYARSQSRRRFLKTAGLVASGALLSACAPSTPSTVDPAPTAIKPEKPVTAGLTDELGDAITQYDAISNYNNFYEFTTDKQGVAQMSTGFVSSPWKVQVGGLVNNPKTFDIDDLRKIAPIERIYRMRCVEAWSMVIPWSGFTLSNLLKQVDPKSEAKYVRFETLLDTNRFPGQRDRSFPWPYTEGLRLDEAMNDLTLLATGIYGKPLLPQNGAPIRLVVPWKYGFKSIKSIVKIDLVAEQPTSLWMKSGPSEYGFYSNVNPEVSHPRWSQSSERRIGEVARRRTLMFNGYADQVASLYAGMDLRKNY